MGELTEFPLDDPPPYRERDLEAIKADTISDKSGEEEETEETPLSSTFRYVTHHELHCWF